MPGEAPAVAAARGRAAQHSGTAALPVPLTSMVGRSADLDTVAGLLRRARLVTLVGAGGCGKTRLAVAVAGREQARGTPVAWWPLDPLREPALVAPSLATALGLAHSRADTAALTGALGDREVLVVADNCEHLAAAVADLVLGLLPACPGMRVLATSRQALEVAGEHVWEVPPLGLPATADRNAVRNAPAVQLFLERAAAAGAALSAQDVPVVGRLVRRLDGMPLAVELAAARTAVMTPAELDEQLDDAFRLLVDDRLGVPPRQRTLHATLAWSHDLLDPAERTLFRRLAVLVGPFDRDAATAVAGDLGPDDPVPVVLSRLVRRHLVHVLPEGGRLSHRLLEPVRQFAAARLAESGEAEEVAWRHARHHLVLVRRLSAALPGPNGAGVQQQVLDHFDSRSPDLRAALMWARDTPGQADLLVDLVVPQWWVWWRLGRFAEGLTWLRAALATGAGTMAERAELLHGLGWLARHQDAPEVARTALTEALQLYDQLGDHIGASYVLHRLAALRLDAAVVAGPQALADGQALVEASEARARAAGDVWARGAATYWHGLFALAEGDADAAVGLLAEARGAFVVAGDQWAVGRTTGMSALALVRAGRLRDAATVLREAERTSAEVRDHWGLARWALHDAEWHLRDGDPREAARACARSAAGFAELGDGLRIVEVARVCAQALDAQGRAAEATQLRAAADATAARSGAGGARLAHQVAELAVPRPARDALPEPLSARELEVLRLVALGRTDAEVAQALFLSVRTVGGHLGSAYRKLGVRSRTAAVRRLAELGLEPGAPSVG